MIKHSPAPWNQGRDANGKPIICQEYDGRCNYGDDNPEYKANCRLIDAAPDLLEACKAADWNGLDLPEQVREMLSAAIEKATGG